MIIPEYLVQFGKESEDHQNWINSLPGTLEKLSNKWNLILENPYRNNISCSYVIDCTTSDNEKAILKIGYPHYEGVHEIDGLKILDGIPTVKLFKFDIDANAMLIEKCVPGTNLKYMDSYLQDTIVCELLNEIWNTNYPKAGFRPLGQMISIWNRETYQNIESFPDKELAKEGCKLKELLIQSTKEKVLLATDLHAGNILKSKRRPWLAIDIKPFIGDRVYDLTQHLMNSLDRLQYDPLELITLISDYANVDKFRLKDWMFARLASENNGAYQDLALKLKY